MINFYDPQYVTAITKYSGVHDSGLWIFESKIKAYKEDLKFLTKSLKTALTIMKTQYENDSQTSNSGNAAAIDQWIASLDDGSMTGLIDGGSGPFAEDEDDTSCQDGNWTCLFDLIQKRTKPSVSEMVSTTGTTYFSSNVIDFYNMFFGKFNEYYIMARQLNNFNCLYLPTFKRLFNFTNGMVDGSIFGYFDVTMDNLYNYIIDLVRYISTAPDGVSESDHYNMIVAIRVTADYDTNGDLIMDAYENVRFRTGNDLNDGFNEFTAIIDRSKSFLDSLTSGIKVISTANIVLTARPEDDSMLQIQSQNGATFTSNLDYTSPYLTNEYRNQLLDDMRVSSTVTQIAINLKPYIRSDFSNFEYIMSKTVTIGLTQTGVLQALDNLTIILGIYEP